MFGFSVFARDELNWKECCIPVSLPAQQYQGVCIEHSQFQKHRTLPLKSTSESKSNLFSVPNGEREAREEARLMDLMEWLRLLAAYSLDVLLSYLEPVCCSTSSSNCCFLTCIQISQEAGQVVWYSHLLENFPQYIVIHTVKGFTTLGYSKFYCLFTFTYEMYTFMFSCI